MLKELHKRILLSLAATHSISQTARDLGISQPAVSVELRRLEKAVEGEVFRHGTRPITFTTLGKIMLEQARKLETLETQTQDILFDYHQGIMPLWQIGCVDSFSSSVMPYFIADLLTTSRRIIVKTGDSKNMEKLLEEGRLDFAVVNSDMTDKGFFCTRLFSEQYQLVIPSEIAQRNHRDISQYTTILQKLPVVFSGALTLDNIVAHQALRTLGFEPDCVMEIDCYSSMCQLISQGKCWGLMTPLGMWVGREHLTNVTIMSFRHSSLRHFYFCRQSNMSEQKENQILKMIYSALKEGFLPCTEKEYPNLSRAITIDKRLSARFGA